MYQPRSPRLRKGFKLLCPRLLLQALLLIQALRPAGGRSWGDEPARIFFSNITQWGPAASKYIHEINKEYPIVALAETHVESKRLPRERELLLKD